MLNCRKQLLLCRTSWNFWEDCSGTIFLKDHIWLWGNIRLSQKNNTPRGPMLGIVIALLIWAFICFALLCMDTSCHPLGCPDDIASGLKHKLNAPHFGYTNAATWGSLSNDPSYKLSTWIWSQNIPTPPSVAISVRSWSTASRDDTGEDRTRCHCGTLDWRMVPRLGQNLRKLAGNVNQPVSHKQVQTGGEVRQERKFVRRKSTNPSASPAEHR